MEDLREFSNEREGVFSFKSNDLTNESVIQAVTERCLEIIIHDLKMSGIEINCENNSYSRNRNAFIEKTKEEVSQEPKYPTIEKDAPSGWTLKFCGNCGKQFWRPDANFCEVCGCPVKKNSLTGK